MIQVHTPQYLKDIVHRRRHKMVRITNDVLAERIGNYHKDMQNNFNRITENMKSIKNNVNLNSDFRKQAKTTVGMVGTIAGILGAFITLIINKIWK